MNCSNEYDYASSKESSQNENLTYNKKLLYTPSFNKDCSPTKHKNIKEKRINKSFSCSSEISDNTNTNKNNNKNLINNTVNNNNNDPNNNNITNYFKPIPQALPFLTIINNNIVLTKQATLFLNQNSDKEILVIAISGEANSGKSYFMNLLVNSDLSDKYDNFIKKSNDKRKHSSIFQYSFANNNISISNKYNNYENYNNIINNNSNCNDNGQIRNINNFNNEDSYRKKSLYNVNKLIESSREVNSYNKNNNNNNISNNNNNEKISENREEKVSLINLYLFYIH